MHSNSLIAGIAIGAASAAVVILTFAQLLQEGVESSNTDTQFFQDGVGAFVYGITREISEDRLIIDQTFNRTGDMGNPAVVVNTQRSGLLLCFESYVTEGAFGCSPVTYQEIEIGERVCAQVFSASDGSLHGNKIFFNASCGHSRPPSS